jgi:hypothetical protein
LELYVTKRCCKSDLVAGLAVGQVLTLDVAMR